VVNPHTVNPAELAMHAATLDEYSGGRVRLGISVGAVEFLRWLGIEARRPLAAMRESIGLIRRLLRGERVEHDGKVFRGWTQDAYMRFKPVRESIPIYLGAQGRRMLELTGEIADGGLPLLFPPEYVEDVLRHISNGAARAGRNIDDLDVVGCIWFSISADPDAAMDALRGLVSFYGPHLGAGELVTDEMAQLAVHGTPEECVDRIEGLVEKGLTHVRFGPPLGSDPEEAIRLIGEEIIPYFKDEGPKS